MITEQQQHHNEYKYNNNNNTNNDKDDYYDLTCTICSNTFDDNAHCPRMLPSCGHTFCTKCIKKVIGRRRHGNIGDLVEGTNTTSSNTRDDNDGEVEFICPEDKIPCMLTKSASGLSLFPKNFVLMRLLDKQKAKIMIQTTSTTKINTEDTKAFDIKRKNYRFIKDDGNAEPNSNVGTTKNAQDNLNNGSSGRTSIIHTPKADNIDNQGNSHVRAHSINIVGYHPNPKELNGFTPTPSTSRTGATGIATATTQGNSKVLRRSETFFRPSGEPTNNNETSRHARKDIITKALLHQITATAVTGTSVRAGDDDGGGTSIGNNHHNMMKSQHSMKTSSCSLMSNSTSHINTTAMAMATGTSGNANTLNASNIMNNNMCKEHNRKLEIICIDHKCRICTNCALFGLHKNHNIKTEEEVLKDITNRGEYLIDLYRMIEHNQNKLYNQMFIDELNLKFKSKYEHIAKIIQEKFQSYIDIIRNLERKTLDEINCKFGLFEEKFKEIRQLPCELTEKINKWRFSAKEKLNALNSKSSKNDIAFELLEDRYNLKNDIVLTGEKLIKELQKANEIPIKSLEEMLNGISVVFNDNFSNIIETLCVFVFNTELMNNSEANNTQKSNVFGSLYPILGMPDTMNSENWMKNTMPKNGNMNNFGGDSFTVNGTNYGNSSGITSTTGGLNMKNDNSQYTPKNNNKSSKLKEGKHEQSIVTPSGKNDNSEAKMRFFKYDYDNLLDLDNNKILAITNTNRLDEDNDLLNMPFDNFTLADIPDFSRQNSIKNLHDITTITNTSLITTNTGIPAIITGTGMLNTTTTTTANTTNTGMPNLPITTARTTTSTSTSTTTATTATSPTTSFTMAAGLASTNTTGTTMTTGLAASNTTTTLSSSNNTPNMPNTTSAMANITTASTNLTFIDTSTPVNANPLILRTHNANTSNSKQRMLSQTFTKELGPSRQQTQVEHDEPKLKILLQYTPTQTFNLKESDKENILTRSYKKKGSIRFPEKYEAVIEGLKLGSLEIVDLTGAELGDNGISYLTDYISSNKHMKSLKLVRNKLTDEGGALLIKSLEKNMTLHTLNLTQNMLTEKTMEGFLGLFKTNLSIKTVYFNQNLISLRNTKNKIKEMTKLGINVSI